MKTAPLRVERRTFDGELAAYWEARLLRRRAGLLIWHAPARTPVIYPRRGFSARLVHHELGWVWLDRHYTVTVELSPEGGLERAIARVCLPPSSARGVLSLVDLGLHLTVEPGPRLTVQDDDFHEQASDFGYPPQLRATAWAALEEARALHASGAGPFGPELVKLHALAMRDNLPSV